MNLRSKVLSLTLVALLATSGNAFATPVEKGVGNDKSNGNSQSNRSDSSPNVDTASVTPPPTTVDSSSVQQGGDQAKEKSNNASAKAEEVKQTIAEKQAVAEQVKAEQAQIREKIAAQEKIAQTASGSKAAEAKAKAAELAEEANAKAAEAKATAKEIAKAVVAAKAAEKVAKALDKVKGIEDVDCLDYVESGSSTDAAECETAQYVIRFNNGVDAAAQVKGMKSVKIPVSQTLDGIMSGAVAELTAKQLKAVLGSGKIQSVEQDFEVTNDPTFEIASTQVGATWGLDRIDQATLPLSGSYTNATSGGGVLAYVVDTGVNYNHSDFTGRVASGFTAVNDGNGVFDCNGHGTHVSGTIAGSTYGVAKAATIVPVRVLDCNGSGYLSGVVAGLDWIASNWIPGTPAVVNMSLGGGVSSTLDSAVENLVSKGITVAVAAGNSAADACTASPARTPGALTVAASDSTDGFAYFSNYGTCVDVIAPGVSITSDWYTSDTATAALSGTSMATPHVAGLIASMMTYGYKSPAEVEYLLESGAVSSAVRSAPTGTPNLLVQVVSVSAPVSESPTVSPEIPDAFQTAPVAPVLTGISTFKTSANVRWDISPDGGSPLLSHEVYVWERGQAIKKIVAGASSTSLKVSGLKRGRFYTFTVRATNAIGQSLDSNVSDSYTPTNR